MATQGRTVNPLIAVGTGGAIGAILRYGLSEWLNSETHPYGTLTVNLLGSLLLGIMMALLAEQIISKEIALLLGTGVLGAFTTMSTFSLETVKMWESSSSLALSYVAITMIICPILAFVGWKAGEFIA
jgi:CrcB protein